ncbi:MAG: efflux RND transporter periplasmic adaptor subunit [Calditrichia bacterium]|nr:efflux RND transporter periplasmic adaptor subunit [Calditrichota bacterium]MCB0285618.1 efflux RND transporter periplasmic adaptor subunit [Calditrichota bacterium]MCB9068637.1 efflux RND transporter periplasmic adaptor subunit [Calditrichia bacterium]
MSKKKILIGSAIVVVIAVAAISFGMKDKGVQGVEVEIAPVQRHKVVQTVMATGRIQPKTQVNISADVSAKIVRLAVNDGDWVEKGQFLLEMDNERYLASVESAEANLRSFQADATLARQNMIKTEKDYHRTKELFDQNLESQASLDAMYAAYEVEKARYQSAQDRVAQAQASLKQSRDDLSKTKIFAPMSGTISQLNKEEGEIALGSQFQEDVIMVISNLSGMEALVDVDENDIVNVAIGDTAKIEVDAVTDVLFTGVVSEIANSAKVSGQGTQEQKTEFEVKIAIAGAVGGGDAMPSSSGSLEVKPADHRPSLELRPGMTASGDIVTDTRKNCLAVPIQAVAVRTVDQLKNNSGPAAKGDSTSTETENEFHPDKDGFVEIVFVVKNGKAEARQVKTGVQSDTHIEILDGLEEGEEIVIGNYRAISKDLQNGSEIVVKENPSTARG